MSELSAQQYLETPMDAPFLTTKHAIETYVSKQIIDYLNGMRDGIWDRYRYNDSEWDKAIEFFDGYIEECMKELKE